MRSDYLKIARTTFAAGLLLGAIGVSLPARAQSLDYLHTYGEKILDSGGRRVILTGINWFGLETPSYAPHGLWARNWESILDQILALGFNTVRLPYSNQLFDPGSAPNGINYELNPDLQGLSGPEIMEKIIEGAGVRGLKVILDRHRPDSHAQSDLWYTAQYSEERWIDDWVMLAQRYVGDDTVIGVDLHNEPHGRATWGTGDPATDWRLAAQRAGNAILAVNPNLLIIVQGVDQYHGDWYWWGGNLMGAREHPVRLDLPNRLVYSSHVYGPGVYPQPWFWDSDFPHNLPAIWDRHWGYLSRERIAPVLVGEFGGRSVGNDKEGIWQRSLVSYLRQNNLSYTYWTFNPNSADTGGLLLDDWQSVDPEKAALLSGYQFSLLGIEARQSEQAALPGPSDVVAGGLRVRYRTADAAPQAQDAKPEFIIVNAGHTTAPLSSVELRYWFRDDGDQPLVFHCDWAQVGCANVLGEFGSTGQGEWYLGLRFTAASTPLGVGEESGEIKVRFNRSDWSEIRQDDDYSFGATMNYVEWERVTLYVDGELVWGVEPGSPVAPSPTSAIASGAASTPAAAASDVVQVPVEPSTEQVLGQPLAESESEVGRDERPGAQPIAVWQALASLGLITSVTLAFVLGLSKLRARLGRAKG